ncbi:MAG: adenosylcobinamide-phosphate synthase CbiB [Desulfobacteraceae bacterium]|jgi:adenosylcobinamide-phosphate synthase
MAISSTIDAVQWLVIPAAFVLDALVGDPRMLPHPVRWMGRSIEICEPFFRRFMKNEYLAGTCFALLLIAGTWGAAFLAVRMASKLHPLLGFGLEVVLIFFCLSARSLSQAGMDINRLLKKGSVEAARSHVAMIVGRDVQAYKADDIARATVETVAENFVDGVLSPLFFAALGGAPMAMAYKMVNTLDSMVGYRNPRYLRFGRAAARIDDAANFIPARLSVIIIALAARMLTLQRGGRALITAVKEGSHHSSPNAGYPEAAFAGALAVRLNGPNTYGGVLVEKPYIGVAFGEVKVHHIQKACELMMLAAFMAMALAWAVRLVWFQFG